MLTRRAFLAAIGATAGVLALGDIGSASSIQATDLTGDGIDQPLALGDVFLLTHDNDTLEMRVDGISIDLHKCTAEIHATETSGVIVRSPFGPVHRQCWFNVPLNKVR